MFPIKITICRRTRVVQSLVSGLWPAASIGIFTPFLNVTEVVSGGRGLGESSQPAADFKPQPVVMADNHPRQRR